MCPEAVVQLTDLLIHLDRAEAFRAERDSGAGSDRVVSDLARFLRLADPELYEHSLRVAHWARRTALELGFELPSLCVLDLAARFHDIGKVPFLRLVNRAGPLSSFERELLAIHPVLGAKMLTAMGPPLLETARLVEAHHVRYEADGRPSLLGARVIAVADAYDAIVSPRPYRAPQTREDALEAIAAESGKQFDPHVVSAFLDVMVHETARRS